MSKKSESKSKKVAVCIYYEDGKKYILTGSNSYWITDEKRYKYLQKDEKVKISLAKEVDMLRWFKNALGVFNNYFSDYCKRESKKLKFKIHYDDINLKVVEKENENEVIVSTNFRKKREGVGSYRSIIKGDKENYESSIDAVIREVKEECGFSVDPSKLHFLCKEKYDKKYHDIFILKVDSEQRKKIEDLIKDGESKFHGELFDMKFTDVQLITKEGGFNDITVESKLF